MKQGLGTEQRQETRMRVSMSESNPRFQQLHLLSEAIGLLIAPYDAVYPNTQISECLCHSICKNVLRLFI